MSDHSAIEWCDATWNPVRGCTKITSGCAHCYAETFAERFRGVPGHPYEAGFDLKLVPHKLLEPFTWPGQRLVFVNSMSDLFHEDVPASYIESVCRVMSAARWHTYLVLTKRHERMARLLSGPLLAYAHAPHIWWGVSVENQSQGLPRVESLRSTPAARKFLSVEPLLENLGEVDLRGIDWVILGGESGHGARPMAPDWARSIRDQCARSGVRFFFKQWGGARKSKTGRTLDDRTHDDGPDRPTVEIPGSRPRKQLSLELERTLSSVVSD